VTQARNVALGAHPTAGGRCRFGVWAPRAQRVQVHLVDLQRREPLEPAGRGYHVGELDDVPPGSRYLFQLDGGPERPDPASRCQSDGVHGPSTVLEPTFPWTDAGWSGRPLDEYVIYELHVGTFTTEGTFGAATRHLDELRDLGVTAVELMPLAQFPGDRNWGYDGVFPFAVQWSYGGPAGLKGFVDACHRHGLAAILDVVYNHLGPEGNYLPEFGDYLSPSHSTPWGSALNFDGPGSDEVRHFFSSNALMWLEEFHFDALRLDAVHAMVDTSARPFLAELAEQVEECSRAQGRSMFLIAESDLNAPRLVRPRAAGGYALDGQWADDFHHALHALLTGERHGYYVDYGEPGQLVRAMRDGFVFQGQHSSYRRRRHGDSTAGLPGNAFVVYAQNHDQIGNRMQGDRLAATLSPRDLRLAAGVVLLSPFVPLLFMGEEYGETAPFPFFVSHGDPALLSAVREGRRREFARFHWSGEPPAPGARATFLSARLNRALKERSPHRELLAFYKELLSLRRELPPLARPSREQSRVTSFEEQHALVLRRWEQEEEALVVIALGSTPVTIPVPAPGGHWRKRLDSSDTRWGGSGSIVPDSLSSEGRLELEIGPRAIVVLQLETPGVAAEA
jgi:maltooligosyltrehalose trehalohydrolase